MGVQRKSRARRNEGWVAHWNGWRVGRKARTKLGQGWLTSRPEKLRRKGQRAVLHSGDHCSASSTWLLVPAPWEATGWLLVPTS